MQGFLATLLCLQELAERRAAELTTSQGYYVTSAAAGLVAGLVARAVLCGMTACSQGSITHPAGTVRLSVTWYLSGDADGRFIRWHGVSELAQQVALQVEATHEGTSQGANASLACWLQEQVLWSEGSNGSEVATGGAAVVVLSKQGTLLVDLCRCSLAGGCVAGHRCLEFKQSVNMACMLWRHTADTLAVRRLAAVVGYLEQLYWYTCMLVPYPCTPLCCLRHVC
jgi:hypothetical protein